MNCDSANYFYFSYGSNMLKERIQINDPDAKPYAAAKMDVGILIISLYWGDCFNNFSRDIDSISTTSVPDGREL